MKYKLKIGRVSGTTSWLAYPKFEVHLNDRKNKKLRLDLKKKNFNITYVGSVLNFEDGQIVHWTQSRADYSLGH